MKFGPVPLAQAEGAILAHSVAMGNGKLRKGRCLTADDIADLRSAGLETVIVARLAADDVHENAAAEALATAVLGARDGLTATTPFTGHPCMI